MSCWSAVPTVPQLPITPHLTSGFTANAVPLAPTGHRPVPTRPAANSAATFGAVRPPLAAREASLSRSHTAQLPSLLLLAAAPTANRAARAWGPPGGVAA